MSFVIMQKVSVMSWEPKVALEVHYKGAVQQLMKMDIAELFSTDIKYY